MTFKINYDSELMDNYINGQSVSPQGKFRALQTKQGHGIVFSRSTDNRLIATIENPGQGEQAGWRNIAIGNLYNGASKVSLPCIRFGANQSMQDSSFSLAMVVDEGDEGHAIYLSLDNSNDDLSWLDNPSWKKIPFDVVNRPSKIEVVDVFFAESANGHETIVVDIVRDPNSSTKLVSRYYIEPSKKESLWKRYDLPIDLEIDSYSSVVGRTYGRKDGLYTVGHIDDSAQIIYSKLKGRDGVAPSVTKLNLPDKSAPSSIASVRHSTESGGLTDLLSVSGTGLFVHSAYRLSKEGSDEPSLLGIKVVDHPLLTNATKLESMIDAQGQITVWGRNQSNQVFYLNCLATVSQSSGEIDNPENWNDPIAVAGNYENFSPYVNRIAGNNTIYVVENSNISRLQRDVSTGIWRAAPVCVDRKIEKADAIKIKSYTTTITIDNVDGTVAVNPQISLTASSRLGCYINGLYYVIDKLPINIEANSNGVLTIIEATNSPIATKLKVSIGGVEKGISPDKSAMKKLMNLGSKNGNSKKLRSAKVKDEKGNVSKLIDKSVDDDDLKRLSTSLEKLGNAYDALEKQEQSLDRDLDYFLPPAELFGGVTKFSVASPELNQLNTLTAPQGSLNDLDVSDFNGDAILLSSINGIYSVGDLLEMVKTGAASIVDFVFDKANQAWNLCLTIAGKVYNAVLATVEALTSALVTVFNVIKTAIGKLIQFLKFLFAFDDIKRTKDAVATMIREQLSELEGDITKFEKTALKTIEQLKIPETKSTDLEKSGLIKSSNQHNKRGSKPKSSSNHLSSHLEHQSGETVEKVHSGGGEFDHLKGEYLLLREEFPSFSDELSKLENCFDDFNQKSVLDIIESVGRVLYNSAIEGVKVVFKFAMKVMRTAVKAITSFIDDEIYIPIVSEILKLFGVELCSWIELVSYAVAIPFTITYKLATGKAPFPDKKAVVRSLPNSSSELTGDELVRVKLAFATQGVSKGVLAVLLPIEGTTPAGTSSIGKYICIFQIVGGLASAYRSKIISYAPLSNTGLRDLRTCLQVAQLGISALYWIGGLFAGGGTPQSREDNKTLRAFKSGINSFFSVIIMIVTINHIIELLNQDQTHDVEMELGEQVSGLFSDIQNFGYLITILSLGPTRAFGIVSCTVSGGVQCFIKLNQSAKA